MRGLATGIVAAGLEAADQRSAALHPLDEQVDRRIAQAGRVRQHERAVTGERGGIQELVRQHVERNVRFLQRAVGAAHRIEIARTGLVSAVVVLRVAGEHHRHLRGRARTVEVAFPARQPGEHLAHRRKRAAVEQRRIAAVDVQPARHPVRELLRDPRPVLRLGGRRQPPPRIEVAHRHPARPVGTERGEVLRLDARPPGRGIAPLAFEGQHVLAVQPVVDVPATDLDGLERLHQLHRRDEDRLRIGRMDRAMHQLHPVGDLPVAPFVERPPDGVLPVFLERDRLAGMRTERGLAGGAVADGGVPRPELAGVVPDAVHRIAGQYLGDDLGHAAAVIGTARAGHVMVADLAQVAVAVAGEPLWMDLGQCLRRAARVDASHHMQALAVRDRHDLVQQVARAQPAADPVAVDLRLVEGDDAAAADAERRGGEALRIGHQRLGLDARLVAFAQVDQQDPVGPLPPGSFLFGHAVSPGLAGPAATARTSVVRVTDAGGLARSDHSAGRRRQAAGGRPDLPCSALHRIIFR